MLSFNCFGNRNIRASHRNTIEFTKERELSARGDCILGVGADYDLEMVKDFIKGKEKIACRVCVDGLCDEFEFIPNQGFNSKNEMVFRLGEFASERTIGLRAAKAAKHIKREIADRMKIPGKKMEVTFAAP